MLTTDPKLFPSINEVHERASSTSVITEEVPISFWIHSKDRIHLSYTWVSKLQIRAFFVSAEFFFSSYLFTKTNVVGTN